MIEEITKNMKAVKLDTLLSKESMHVLTLPVPEEAPMKQFKLMFSKGQTIGFVIDDTLYIHPDFYQGGRYFNVFYEKEANLVKTTYRLKAVMPLELDTLLAPLMNRLIEVEKISQTEVDLEKMELLKVEAEELAGKLQNDHATRLYHQVTDRLVKMNQALGKDKAEEIKEKIFSLLELCKAVKTPEEFAPLMEEINDNVKKLMATGADTKDFVLEISKRVSDLQNLHEAEEEEVIDPEKLAADKKHAEERDKKNREYIELIKKADDQFDRKKYHGALEKYELALELKPEMKHPIKRIAECKKLLKS